MAVAAIGTGAAVTGAAIGTAIADVGTAAAGAGALLAWPPASHSVRGGLITVMATVIRMEAMATAIPITRRPLTAVAIWYGALTTRRMEQL